MIHKNPSNSVLSFFLLLCLIFAGAPVARAEMLDHPVVKLQSLDKSTARTMTFEARVGSTVKFGPLYIKIQACRKAPPIEQPESAAFLQIWEVTSEEKAKWVFSGWMFASSPALSPMDHPIYDVWVIDCLDELPAEKSAEENAAPDGDADAASDNAADKSVPEDKSSTVKPLPEEAAAGD